MDISLPLNLVGMTEPVSGAVIDSQELKLLITSPPSEDLRSG